MKKFLGLVGLFLITMYGWAAPEKMEMYATLSAPIASFWEVKTEGCQAVTMLTNSSLNLGSSSSTKGGTITVTGNNKPLSIGTLRMEKGTKLKINNARWFVNTIDLRPTGTLEVKGDNSGLIIDTLEFSDNINKTYSDAITIKANVLRVDQAITTPKGEFGSIRTKDNNANCSSGDFCFVDNGGPANATWNPVSCSKNENNDCQASTYLLIGG